jgi:hypothetical protein
MSQLKYSLEATYEDGHKYVSGQDDVSIKDASRNAFHDIKAHLESNEHGKMLTFSLVCQEANADGTFARYDVNWAEVPANAKPIYYIKNERTHAYNSGTNEIGALVTHKRTFGFGYEYTDDNGQKQQYVMECI